MVGPAAAIKTEAQAISDNRPQEHSPKRARLHSPPITSALSHVTPAVAVSIPRTAVNSTPQVKTEPIEDDKYIWIDSSTESSGDSSSEGSDEFDSDSASESDSDADDGSGSHAAADTQSDTDTDTGRGGGSSQR